MATPPKFRRTRIVCISDTHNCTVNLPPGDVLIHAGDLTNQGSYSELSKTVKWLEAADYEAKIVVAGNHDITLDADFYFHHGHGFHSQDAQDADDCLALLTSSPSITYLCHDSTTIRLKSPKGPRTELTVFGSPYSPRHGLWAFYYDVPKSMKADGDVVVDEDDEDVELTALWELIPLETDIVVTHTPPRTHRDTGREGQFEGCEALRQALWRVRPRLAVCGHIHGGRGAERVIWDLENRRRPYAEKMVVEWEDPGLGNNKQSLLDLTGRKQKALRNDGSHPGRPAVGTNYGDDDDDGVDIDDDDDDDDDDNVDVDQVDDQNGNMKPNGHGKKNGLLATNAKCASSGVSRYGYRYYDSGIGAQDSRGTIGYGFDPLAAVGDVEALRGRMGRKETCVVNAAIMKKSYPHAGGKELNKPIVVDIDLPVWGGGAEEEEEVEEEE